MDNALLNRTIEYLLLPPGNLLLLILLLLLLFIRGKQKMLMCTLLALGLLQIVIFSLPATAHWLMAGLEQQHPPQADLWTQDQLPQAIVVLGAGRNRNVPEYGGESTSHSGLERLRYAALLHRKTGLPILLSGGRPIPNLRSEAELMRDVLVDEYNVPVRWLETESHTTWQNAEYSHKILQDAGIQSAWLVTQAWHMPRGMLVFQNRGIDYQPAATSFNAIIPWSDLYMKWIPQPAALTRSMIALHEWLGLIWYKLRQRQSS